MTRPPMIILAGGKGTRLGRLTKDTPKPMVLVKGRPFLHLLIDEYRTQGFDTFIVCTGYLAEKIEDYDFGPGVSFSRDPWDWGPDLALATGSNTLDEYWVCNGDTWVCGDIPKPVVDSIFIFNNKDSGLYYKSTNHNRPRIDYVYGFIDMGTRKGLRDIKAHLENR